ncbi:MAG: rod shape-determining protein MreC [Rhodobacteraceae bacterium]|nr:rod shape-determining protein MreC [Paracoccaceae bacterium]
MYTRDRWASSSRWVAVLRSSSSVRSISRRRAVTSIATPCMRCARPVSSHSTRPRALMQWQTIARQLEAENAALKQLLHFVPDPEVRFVTARVVADSGGAFAHSVLLGAGLRDGVGKGQPVVADQALVGRIAGVSERSARVLLITDLNSRIPVLVGSTRTRAILAGDNSDKLELVYLSSEAVVSPGDRIITSGHAGVFPAGIPVGVVTSVGDGEIRVKPFVDRERLEYLRVIDYGLSGIIGETLEMVPKAPPKSVEPMTEPDSRGGVEP